MMIGVFHSNQQWALGDVGIGKQKPMQELSKVELVSDLIAMG